MTRYLNIPQLVQKKDFKYIYTIFYQHHYSEPGWYISELFCRISSSRQVFYYSVCGIFDFTWQHRHQIDGTNDRLPKDTGKVGSFTKGNCQSLQAAPVGFEPAIQYNTCCLLLQFDIRRNKARQIVQSQRVVRWLTFR